MSNPRSPPFPVINPQPGFWESVDNMTPSERMTSLFASFAGAAIGIYAGAYLCLACGCGVGSRSRLSHHNVCTFVFIAPTRVRACTLRFAPC